MKRINKKGFTLVELLAVIVVLAIIMIIAMPNIVRAMNAARESAFRTYSRRVIGTAVGNFEADNLLNEDMTNRNPNRNPIHIGTGGMCDATTATGFRCYCYDLADLGFTNSSYQGFVVIRESNADRSTVSYITLTDMNRSMSLFTLDETHSVTMHTSIFERGANPQGQNTCHQFNTVTRPAMEAVGATTIPRHTPLARSTTNLP